MGSSDEELADYGKRAVALVRAHFKKGQVNTSGVLVLIDDATGHIELTLMNNTPAEAYAALLYALQAMYEQAGRIYPHETMQ